MKRTALNGVMMASGCLVLGLAALGPSALADRNPRISSLDYIACDDLRGMVLPRFVACRGDGSQSIESILVRCSDLKRRIAATLPECALDSRGGNASNNGGGGTGPGPGNGGNGGNDGDNDGDDDHGGGGGKGPSAMATATGSGSQAKAKSGIGGSVSVTAGPTGAGATANWR